MTHARVDTAVRVRGRAVIAAFGLLLLALAAGAAAAPSASAAGIPGWPALPADPGPIPPHTTAVQLGPAAAAAGDGPQITAPVTPRSAPTEGLTPPTWWAGPPARPVASVQPRYGFADAGSDFLAYARAPAFRALAARMDVTGHGLDYVRFFVPYDALATWNPGAEQCGPSLDFAAHSGGGAGSAWAGLVSLLQAATADGLTPELSVTGPTADGATGGAGLPAEPGTPEPTYGAPGRPQAGLTQAALDYSCGLEYLTYYVQAMASRLHYTPPEGIEAWNEPDTEIQSASRDGNGGGYNGPLAGACASEPNTTTDPETPARINECGGTVADAGGGLCGSATASGCGPLEAAWLWEDAEQWSQYWAAHPGPALPGIGVLPVAALTISRPQNDAYVAGYLNGIDAMSSCRAGFLCLPEAPAVYAIHDYDDPTSGSTADADLAGFDAQLTAAAPGHPTVWVTEAAVSLTDHGHDRNRPRGCPGPAVRAPGLASCVDGQPAAQATGAEAFLGMAGVARGAPITEAFWYELQPANASTGFDSGLVAPPEAQVNAWGQVAPDGVSGNLVTLRGLRASYCVLAGLPAAACTPSLVAASPWSVQPQYVTGHLQRGSRLVTRIVVVPHGAVLADIHRGAWVTAALLGQPGRGIPAGTRIVRIERRRRRYGGLTWVLTRPATAGGAHNLTTSGG